MTNTRSAGVHCFSPPLQRAEGGSVWDVLARETQLTRLELPLHYLPRDDLPKIYQQLGSLTALRHLDAWGSTEPKASDCCALERLQQLTTLAIRYGHQVC